MILPCFRCICLLQELDLSFNLLEGNPVISTLADFRRLRQYKVQFNNLYGRLPTVLNDAPSTLYRFWVNDNYISGELPDGVLNRWGSFMQSLDLRRNRFLCGNRPNWKPRRGWIFACIGGQCGIHTEGTQLGTPCEQVLPTMPMPTKDCATRWFQCGAANNTFTGPTDCCDVDAQCTSTGEGFSVCQPTTKNTQEIPFTCAITNQQCGGAGEDSPSSCCYDKDACIETTEGNRTCVPVSATGTPTCAPMYTQCGGREYDGPRMCCNYDAACIGTAHSLFFLSSFLQCCCLNETLAVPLAELDQFYSQCQPARNNTPRYNVMDGEEALHGVVKQSLTTRLPDSPSGSNQPPASMQNNTTMKVTNRSWGKDDGLNGAAQ